MLKRWSPKAISHSVGLSIIVYGVEQLYDQSSSAPVVKECDVIKMTHDSHPAYGCKSA